MTFNEWMRSHEPKHCDSDDSMSLRLLRKCWDNAKQDERERIASYFDGSDTFIYRSEVAAAIRARKD